MVIMRSLLKRFRLRTWVLIALVFMGIGYNAYRFWSPSCGSEDVSGVRYEEDDPPVLREVCYALYLPFPAWKRSAEGKTWRWESIGVGVNLGLYTLILTGYGLFRGGVAGVRYVRARLKVYRAQNGES